MENGGEDPRNDSETPRSEPVANPVAPPKEGEHPDGVHDASDAQTGRKAEKAEPINIVVRDQSGAGLQFKVRKNTKFEKVNWILFGLLWEANFKGDDGFLSKEACPNQSSSFSL